MNDYECLTCSYQFKEDQLVTVPGTFECYCPQCGSEDLKDTDEARASWPKPITVMPVSTFGLEHLARKMKEPA